MTNVVALTDGTTTISLSSSGCLLTNYTPQTPEPDGAGGWKPVTEAIEFVIADTTVGRKTLNPRKGTKTPVIPADQTTPSLCRKTLNPRKESIS